MKCSKEVISGKPSDMFWRYEKAPTGQTVALLTVGSIMIKGKWEGEFNEHFMAWHPLLKRDKDHERKHKLGMMYQGRMGSENSEKETRPESTSDLKKKDSSMQVVESQKSAAHDEPHLKHKDDDMKNKQTINQYSHYHKDVTGYASIDVYDVCDLFKVRDDSGCLQHAIKKLLCAGERGSKDLKTDIEQARDTLTRKLDMMGGVGELPQFVEDLPLQFRANYETLSDLGKKIQEKSDGIAQYKEVAELKTLKSLQKDANKAVRKAAEGMEAAFADMVSANANGDGEPMSEITDGWSLWGWKLWGGGECPVDSDERVDVYMRNGRSVKGVRAGACYWERDGSASLGEVLAYKCRKPNGKEEVNRWIWWKGGECPVDPDTKVHVMLRNGDMVYNTSASSWRWVRFDELNLSDIAAYKLAKDADNEYLEGAGWLPMNWSANVAPHSVNEKTDPKKPVQVHVRYRSGKVLLNVSADKVIWGTADPDTSTHIKSYWICDIESDELAEAMEGHNKSQVMGDVLPEPLVNPNEWQVMDWTYNMPPSHRARFDVMYRSGKKAYNVLGENLVWGIRENRQEQIQRYRVINPRNYTAKGATR